MKNIITTPVCNEDITGLRTGDIIYLSGILATGRDDVHRRVVQENMECPFNFNGNVIFHAGPIVRKMRNYEIVSVGPTTSMRMETWEADFMVKTGVKIIIGKGGMGDKTTDACHINKVIHCVYPGGCAVLGAGQVENIENVFWQELGMPECIWVMKVREFGPLIVSIDTEGNNLFRENAACYASRKEECIKKIFTCF